VPLLGTAMHDQAHRPFRACCALAIAFSSMSLQAHSVGTEPPKGRQTKNTRSTKDMAHGLRFTEFDFDGQFNAHRNVAVGALAYAIY
jgi:hypothetical protein